MTEKQPFALGQIVTWLGDDKGTEVFKVTGYGGDGSVTLWGGAKGEYAYRSIMPDKLMRWYGDGPKKVDGAAAPATRKAGKR